LHRLNSTYHELIPKKSSLGIDPNSEKNQIVDKHKNRKNKDENHSFKIGTLEGKRRIWTFIPTPKP
jgi:hypothetical protein